MPLASSYSPQTPGLAFCFVLPFTPKKKGFLFFFFFLEMGSEKRKTEEEKKDPLFCVFVLHASSGVCVCVCRC